MVLIDISDAERLSDYCEHQLIDLINDEKVAHMVIIKEQDDFMVYVNSCCPCQCPDRYKKMLVKKNDFYKFLTDVLKSNHVVRDTIFDLH